MANNHVGDDFDIDNPLVEDNEEIPELVLKIEPKKLDFVDFENEEDPYLRLPCMKCRKNSTTQRCANCKSVYYCSRECQKKDWKSHKKHCLDLRVFKKKSDTEKKPFKKVVSDQLHLRNLLKEAVSDENIYNFQVIKDLLDASEDKNPFVDCEDDGTPITLLQMAANYGRMDVFEHIMHFRSFDRSTIPNMGELMKTCMVNYNNSVLDEMFPKDKKSEKKGTR